MCLLVDYVQYLGKEPLLATDAFLFVYIICRRYHHVKFISFGEAFVVLTLSKVLCPCGIYCHFNSITQPQPLVQTLFLGVMLPSLYQLWDLKAHIHYDRVDFTNFYLKYTSV